MRWLGLKTKGILSKSEIPFCVDRIDNSKFIFNTMLSSSVTFGATFPAGEGLVHALPLIIK